MDARELTDRQVDDDDDDDDDDGETGESPLSGVLICDGVISSICLD